MLRQLTAFVAALSVASSGSAAIACIHAMKGDKVVPAPTQFQAIVAWHDGVEDLVLRPAVSGSGASVAYVVPVPSAPIRYAIADEQLFPELDRHLDVRRDIPPSRSRGVTKGGSRGKTKSDAVVPHITLLAAQSVGPYEIQPIQAVGSEGLKALNEWMDDNEFQKVPSKLAKHYVDRNWTFLAIKLDPKGSQDATIPPLHVRFASKSAVLPLKLLNPLGEISVGAFVITPAPLTKKTVKSTTRLGFEVLADGEYSAPQGSKEHPLVASNDEISPHDGPVTVMRFAKSLGWPTEYPAHVAVVRHEAFDGGARWKEDPSFGHGKATKGKSEARSLRREDKVDRLDDGTLELH